MARKKAEPKKTPATARSTKTTATKKQTKTPGELRAAEKQRRYKKLDRVFRKKKGATAHDAAADTDEKLTYIRRYIHANKGAGRLEMLARGLYRLVA